MFKRRSYGYGSSREKKFSSKILVLALVVLLACYFGYRKYITMNLASANEAVAAQDWEKAETGFKRVANLPFSSANGHDGLGALDLLRDNPDGAKAHFAKVLEKKPGRMGADPHIIFQAFFFHGRYAEAGAYRDFLSNWKSADELKPYALDFAAIALADYDLDGARKHLDATPANVQDQNRYRKLNQLVKDYETDGFAPVMLDRNGAPVLIYDLNKASYEFKSPKLFQGWSDEKGPVLKNLSATARLSRIRSTLDLNLQKAAHQAMSDYNGTMIMADPNTGDILAAYGTEGYSPFDTGFEPGSVMKVLTYGVFLNEGGDTTAYAPKMYPGNMEIGGKIFYDWTTQGQLRSINEGMAVSCNLMFAQMGNDLGWSNLNRGFQRLFNGNALTGFLGDARYGKLVNEPEGAWELGRAAIGLDYWETTVLGLLQIPLAVANKGQLAEPRLILQYTDVEGGVYQDNSQVETRELFSQAIAQELLMSMEASVYFERGTARRAMTPFVKTAMKTGTAGERPFDSVMVGLFPMDNPKVAFAFFLHKGGKCEINGGRVAKRLQEQIKALAPEYLGGGR